MMPWYCTREDVKSVLEIKHTARVDALIDKKVAAASRSIEGQLRRPRLAPTLMTVKFDYPNFSFSPAWTLELDSNEVISLTEVLSGGVDITADCILRRGDDTSIPPFNRIEISLSSSAALSAGASFQQAIHVTGLFGYTNDEESIGVLAGALDDAEGATASITWSTADMGVGDLLRIDDERMIITNRTWVASGQTITEPLTASKANVAVPVSSGAAFAVDEIIIVDVERMRIVDIVGNTLSVERAWDGTVLAAHADNASVFAYTGVQLARGQLGTAIAAHDAAAVIRRWIVPSQAREFAKAEAIVALEQDAAAWARVVGSGATAREASGKGLEDARQQAINTMGRKYRLSAI